MSKANMTAKILEALYESWEKSTSCLLNQLCNENGWDREAFEDVVNSLEGRGLIEQRAQWDYKATADGIIFAEKQAIIPKERSDPHRRTRREILAALAKFRAEKGKRERIYYKDLCREAGIDESLFLDDEEVLRELGYIESVTVGCYQITDEGMKYV